MKKIVSVTNKELVTPKAGAQHELWFNEPASEAGLLNEGPCLARPLGVINLQI